MPRSILEIDMKDSAYKRFHADFSKYQDEVKKMPGVWGKMDRAAKASFEGTAAVFAIQANLFREFLETQKKSEQQNRKNEDGARKISSHWRNIAASGASFAGSMAKSALQITKWLGIGALTGLAGAGGGLFGLSRLASGASDVRRSALGLGVSYGERQSFGVNFGRFVDTDSFLGSVNEAQTDVSRRWALYGAGLGERQISGKNAAQIGAMLLPALKRIADQTPTAMMAQVLQARGLSQFASTQDLMRLRNTRWEELSQQEGRFGGDARAMNANARRWQDLNTTLERSKEKITGSFLRGLERITGPMEALSDSVAKSVETFMSSPELKKWLDQAGQGLEKFAGYVGSGQFQTDVKGFVSNLGKAAQAIVNFAEWVDRHSQKFTPHAPTADQNDFNRRFGVDGFVDWVQRSVGMGSRPFNNPGNLRVPGNGSAFQRFNSLSDGYDALQKQLMLYYNGQSSAAGHRKLQSIRDIISTYAPASENNTAAYISDVSKRLGVSPTDQLNLSNKAVLANLVAAIVRHEGNSPDSDLIAKVTGARPGGTAQGRANRQGPAAIKVEINNAVGANVDVTAGALAGWQ